MYAIGAKGHSRGARHQSPVVGLAKSVRGRRRPCWSPGPGRRVVVLWPGAGGNVVVTLEAASTFSSQQEASRIPRSRHSKRERATLERHLAARRSPSLAGISAHEPKLLAVCSYHAVIMIVSASGEISLGGPGSCARWSHIHVGPSEAKSTELTPDQSSIQFHRLARTPLCAALSQMRDIGRLDSRGKSGI